MAMDLDDWLDSADTPEADWGAVVLKRALSGQLASTEDGILLDLLALTQPHACRPALCTPGLRESRHRSCCADLEVGLAEDEEQAIEAELPRIERAMADDPRWQSGAPDWTDDGVLVRSADSGSRRKRCVFAENTPDGLRCVLHRIELEDDLEPGALKPMPCRLFPLAVVDMGDGRLLLTAVHKKTANALSSRPARVFPCLSVDAPPLYVSEQQVIVQIFGEHVFDAIVQAASD